MNCEQWRELASEYVEGTLTGSRRNEADAHVAACVSCRQDAAALRGIAGALRAWPEEETPLFFADNVMARIERESRQERGWRALLPRLSRVGVGTVVAGGALAALAMTLFLPHQNQKASQAGVLPGAAANPAPVVGAAPKLSVRWTQRADAADPTLDVALTLENAEKGTARCELPGDSTPYRFTFTGGVPQTLKIPLAAARGEKTLAVKVVWNADTASHERYLILPVPQTDAAPAPKQSFGVRDLPLPDAARELSARYGQPVILDDVPVDSRVALHAAEETAEQVLRRQVEPLGLTVKTVDGALQVTRTP